MTCCGTCKTLWCDYISQSSRHVSHFYFQFLTQPLLADRHHPNVDKGRLNQPTTAMEDGADGHQDVGATHFILFFALLTVYLPAYSCSTACRMSGHLGTTASRVDHHCCACRASTTTCVSFHLRYIRSGGSHRHIDHHTQQVR